MKSDERNTEIQRNIEPINDQYIGTGPTKEKNSKNIVHKGLGTHNNQNNYIIPPWKCIWSERL